jgi:hypothetical protein
VGEAKAPYLVQPTAREVLDAAMSEGEFLSSLLGTPRDPGLCDVLGLPAFHLRDSRGSATEGMPDLWVVDWRHGVVYGWELKTQAGRLRVKQREVLAAMEQCTRFSSGLLRPSSYPAIERLLRDGG